MCAVRQSCTLTPLARGRPSCWLDQVDVDVARTTMCEMDSETNSGEGKNTPMTCYTLIAPVVSTASCKIAHAGMFELTVIPSRFLYMNQYPYLPTTSH